MRKIKVISGFLLQVLILYCGFNNLVANNLKIENIRRDGDKVSFTLSWENSWNINDRIPENHDAVWVFIKFRECGTTGEWNHALLSTNMNDHDFELPLRPAMPILATDRFGNGTGHNTGVMIRKTTYGVENIVLKVCTLRVVGSTQGVIMDPAKEYDINVFGIEMVYIPQAAFWLGDNVSTNRFGSQATGNTLPPIRIMSEAPVTVDFGGPNTPSVRYFVNVPAGFPKGFDGFYIMKYEISQGQYVDFLNSLSTTQATNRYPNKYGLNMHGISYNSAAGMYYTDYPDRACNFLSINDVLSYLDFAALRPITEFEFEKACRGRTTYVEGEYVFGRAIADSLIETKIVTGNAPGLERVADTPKSNANYNGTTTTITGGAFLTGNVGPVEVGIYARTTPRTRTRTGATFYGVQEMGGNLSEVCVQVNTNLINNAASDASAYTGIWGDGVLTAAGLYNTTNWPVNQNIARRGGSLNDPAERLRTSDRGNINNTNYNERLFHYGGRGAR